MKRFKKIILAIIPLLFLTGCNLIKDNLENAKIYTTIYPVEYLTNFLYGEYAEIESIYPSDLTDIDNYSLTKKQIKNYAKCDLFVYNGKSNEKNVAKDLVNKNRNLLIIDVAYDKVSYNYDVKEIWLSPNNYLMLAKNIRDQLTDNLKSQKIIDYVNNKYKELDEIISLKDADLRAIGKNAKERGTNTLVVSDDAFKFLEDYGFEIVSLDEDNAPEGTFATVESNFKKKAYNTIIVLDNNYTKNINKLIEEYKAKVIDVSSMTTKTSNDDYLNAMQSFIDNIRNLTIVD